MNEHNVLGVDIGGSHITAAVIDLRTGHLWKDTYVRFPVNAHGSADEIITAWSKAISGSFATRGHEGERIGIAMPGPFDYERGISLIKDQDKFDALYQLDVKALLANSLAIEGNQIRMMNDAGCFLSGEVLSGAAKGFKKAIGLTLGTGLGAARYYEGRGEDAALWCAAFKEGIAEDYLSTRWFKERYKAVTGKNVKDVKAIATVADTDKAAKMIFEEFGTNLSAFLIPYLKKERPEVIVIGGNIANAAGFFFPALEKGLQKSFIDIPLRKAMLGEEAALIGAASCWK